MSRVIRKLQIPDDWIIYRSGHSVSLYMIYGLHYLVRDSSLGI